MSASEKLLKLYGDAPPPRPDLVIERALYRALPQLVAVVEAAEGMMAYLEPWQFEKLSGTGQYADVFEANRSALAALEEALS